MDEESQDFLLISQLTLVKSCIQKFTVQKVSKTAADIYDNFSFLAQHKSFLFFERPLLFAKIIKPNFNQIPQNLHPSVRK